MSRNAKKLEEEKSGENKPEKNIPKQKKTNDNPFGLSFVIPTETVELPSKGDYYPKGHPMSGVKKLEIKHMTAKEEDILATPTNENEKELLFDKLVNSLLSDKRYRSEDLLEDDKMALLLAARVTGYGPHYHGKVGCFNCGKQFDATFDLTKTGVIEPEIGGYDAETNTYQFELPVTKFPVKLKNITPADEKALEEEKKTKKDLNIKYSPSESYMNMILLSVNDVTDPALIRQLTPVLPAGDVKALRSFYLSCEPRLSTKQETKCTHCGSISEKEAPLSWAFFRTDV